MTESEFSDLIRRYQSGTCTRQEKELVEKWLESRTESRQSEKLAPAEYKEILSDISTGLLDKINLEKEQRVIPLSWWRMAAAFLVVGLLSYFLWYVTYGQSVAEPTILKASTSVDEVRKVMLSDGTIIWLKGKSSITYPTEFSDAERNVTFTGEALFEVAKDAKRPFIVSSGDFKTTVLGTSFNLKTSAENVEVLVLTGKVALTFGKHAERIIVMPNQKAILNNVSLEPEKAEAKIAEQQKAIERTEYDMSFRDTRMDDVMTRIERKFDVSTSLEDQTLGSCMITIDLTDQSLDRTLEMVSAILGFTYEIDNRNILIRGEGCETLQ